MPASLKYLYFKRLIDLWERVCRVQPRAVGWLETKDEIHFKQISTPKGNQDQSYRCLSCSQFYELIPAFLFKSLDLFSRASDYFTTRMAIRMEVRSGGRWQRALPVARCRFDFLSTNIWRQILQFGRKVVSVCVTGHFCDLETFLLTSSLASTKVQLFSACILSLPQECCCACRGRCPIGLARSRSSGHQDQRCTLGSLL